MTNQKLTFSEWATNPRTEALFKRDEQLRAEIERLRAENSWLNAESLRVGAENVALRRAIRKWCNGELGCQAYKFADGDNP